MQGYWESGKQRASNPWSSHSSELDIDVDEEKTEMKFAQAGRVRNNEITNQTCDIRFFSSLSPSLLSFNCIFSLLSTQTLGLFEFCLFSLCDLSLACRDGLVCPALKCLCHVTMLVTFTVCKRFAKLWMPHNFLQYLPCRVLLQGSLAHR